MIIAIPVNANPPPPYWVVVLSVRGREGFRTSERSRLNQRSRLDVPTLRRRLKILPGTRVVSALALLVCNKRVVPLLLRAFASRAGIDQIRPWMSTSVLRDPIWLCQEILSLHACPADLYAFIGHCCRSRLELRLACKTRLLLLPHGCQAICHRREIMRVCALAQQTKGRIVHALFFGETTRISTGAKVAALGAWIGGPGIAALLVALQKLVQASVARCALFHRKRAGTLCRPFRVQVCRVGAALAVGINAKVACACVVLLADLPHNPELLVFIRHCCWWW